MLEIVTPATDRSLVSLDDVKSELNITETTDDIELSRLIASASRRIVSYTGREFVQETIKESLGTQGNTYRLVLERTPIVSITSITYDGDTVDTADYAIEFADLGFVRSLTTAWRKTTKFQKDINLIPNRFNDLLYEVTYVGGYSLNATGSEIEVPDDIKQATLEVLKSWWVMRGRDSLITWERIGDAEERRADPTKFTVPPAAKSILDPWVRLDSISI